MTVTIQAPAWLAVPLAVVVIVALVALTVALVAYAVVQIAEFRDERLRGSTRYRDRHGKGRTRGLAGPDGPFRHGR